jgi:hypothetical protein
MQGLMGESSCAVESAGVKQIASVTDSVKKNIFLIDTPPFFPGE